MHRFEGGCHCGNLAYVFEASRSLDEMGLRACMCGFCRAHGARNASDPKGAMRITIEDAGKLVRYRFGLRTADFLLCGNCGVYIGALLPESAKGWFTVNVNTLRPPPPVDAPLSFLHYDSEGTTARIDRRREKWTPVALLHV